MLVIQGDAGRIVPIGASGLRTAKLIKGSRLLVLKGAPHCITWTHADEVNCALVNFLAEGSADPAKGMNSNASNICNVSLPV